MISNLLRRFSLLVAMSALVVAAFALTAGTSTAAAKPVFWIDLAGQASQHPKFVYFTANSGGQVHSITWRKWGKKKAVGKGRYRDTSASFPGKLNQNGPAKLVAWKPKRCTPEFGDKKRKSILVYRHVKLFYPDGRGGTTTANVSATAGYLTCRGA